MRYGDHHFVQSILIIFYSMLKLKLIIFRCPVFNSSIRDLVTQTVVDWVILFVDMMTDREGELTASAFPCNVFTDTCHRNSSTPHAATPRWLKTVFRLKSLQNQYQFSSTVPKRWFGEVQCDLFYLEKARFVLDINFQGIRCCVFSHSNTLKVHFYSPLTL